MMITKNVEHLLSSLQLGTFDVANGQDFERISAQSLIDDLKKTHPLVFQERVIGTKHEIGLAAEISHRPNLHCVPGSLFLADHGCPVLIDCYFISTYEDRISEITWADEFRIRPIHQVPAKLGLSFGRGYKLDKTIDGWTLKALLKRESELTEEFLVKRGWQFQAVASFGVSAPIPSVPR